MFGSSPVSSICALSRVLRSSVMIEFLRKGIRRIQPSIRRARSAPCGEPPRILDDNRLELAREIDVVGRRYPLQVAARNVELDDHRLDGPVAPLACGELGQPPLLGGADLLESQLV